jgi:hypothetical protein
LASASAAFCSRALGFSAFNTLFDPGFVGNGSVFHLPASSDFSYPAGRGGLSIPLADSISSLAQSSFLRRRLD